MVSPARLSKHHLFVELADPRAFGGPRQKYSIQSAIRNRAAIDDGDLPRALPRGQFVGKRSQVRRGLSSANSSDG